MQGNNIKRKLTNIQRGILSVIYQDDKGWFDRYRFAGNERRSAIGLQKRGFIRALNKNKSYFTLTKIGNAARWKF